MKGKLYKKGDIIVIGVHVTEHVFFVSENGASSYALIEHIQDIETGEKYSQYNVITGWGDENSKVEIACRIINNDFKLEQEMNYFDPHNVGLHEENIKDQIIKYSKYIETYKKLLLVGNEKEILNIKLKKIKEN